MRIVVLIKEVPDTWSERRLDLGTGIVDRGSSDAVMDEIGERAVEVALTYKDGVADTEVVVVAMGPASAKTILRKALAMGATSAVHIVDDRLRGADMARTASVLAAAIRRIGFDLVIAGNESTDGRGGVVPAMIAEHLGVAHATSLATVVITDAVVSGDRVGESEMIAIEARLPAVISITERLPDARFPSFKGTMAAKKRPLETLTVDDIGAVPPVGGSSIMSVEARPHRSAGVKIVDTGDAGRQLAEFFESKRLI
jgi:electron transfer flavoprotein beta subunit